MTEPPRILYCHCAYAQVVPTGVKAAVLRQLCESGVSFEGVADLCELSARQDPVLQRLAEGAPLKIAACYPRAVRWLFAAAKTPLPLDRIEVLNMRVLNAEEVVAGILDPALKPNMSPGHSVPPASKPGAGVTAAVPASTAVVP